MPRAWQDWLATPAGRYALQWEQSQCDLLVADLFGFHALQCGLPELHALRANRMPDRILALEPATRIDGRGVPARTWHAPDLPSTDSQTAGADRAAPAVSGSAAPEGRDADPAASAGQADVHLEAPASDRLLPVPTVDLLGRPGEVRVERFDDLPFADSSIDLVVLPHVLEFSADPHRVLRDVARVLRPEGRVIVTGFNPVSLWGLRHRALSLVPPPFLPGDAAFINPPRLKDWLKLLSFDVERVRYGCFRPPCRTQAWLDRTEFMEKAGDRWWPICGALYGVAAVKRVHGMRIIGPAWRNARPKRAAVAVASPQRARPEEQGR